ncbi:MAG: electron transfer flavoprotein subunit alpha [Actinomycetia bacterium]|nr:electron transfer flavoprotein subunit alpha [Actinomycetes bacterium]
MKIVVAYKWARDPQDAAVRRDGSIDWRGARMTAGEDDPAAVTVARAIAAASDRTLVGLTIGDGDASWALARGVPSAVAVGDAPSLADHAATARVLAAAIRRIGEVDVVVIADAEAYPGVPAALAGFLGWPVLLGISDARVEDGRLRATRRIGDAEQALSLPPPAVLGVAAAGAEARPPGMKEILAARKRPVDRLTLADLGVDAIDRLQSRERSAPEARFARLFDGDPEQAAARLVAALRADGTW